MEKKSDPLRGPFGDPESIDDLAKMYMSAVSTILASLKDYEEKSGARGADVLYVLAQAQTRWLTGALRYWTQIASIVGNQGVNAVEALQPDPNGPSDDAKRLILLDKARAALREISDLSLSEAKLLQRDLMTIEKDLRAAFDADALKRDDAHRYAKVKDEQ